MKKIFIALLIMLSINKSFSQSAGALVTGSITKANKTPVESATIFLLTSNNYCEKKIFTSSRVSSSSVVISE